MFKLFDGREHFFQWDLDRKLIVSDATITQVHFCNRTDDCSLVCETYEIDGTTVVDVPNILLQTAWRIRAYAYRDNYTKVEECFEVIPRTKPADYVYTETEVLNYNTLLERINEIDEDIAETVKDYLTENPPEVDLTGYATETYVNDAIAAIELTPGPQGEPGKDGKDGEPGANGKDGEPGKDGKDGEPGKDGKDGYTPVKGVDYFDGVDGKDGENGKDGADGHTPVKGTDYWTETDKAEIVADVLEALPAAEEVEV